MGIMLAVAPSPWWKTENNLGSWCHSCAAKSTNLKVHPTSELLCMQVTLLLKIVWERLSLTFSLKHMNWCQWREKLSLFSIIWSSPGLAPAYMIYSAKQYFCFPPFEDSLSTTCGQLSIAIEPPRETEIYMHTHKKTIYIWIYYRK